MEKANNELSLPGMFYRRREDWVRYVLRLKRIDKSEDLSDGEKLVAIYIAQTLNPKSRSWVTSQAKIAKDLEFGERVVKSAVAKLKKKGLLKVERVKIAGKTKLFNAYSIVPPDAALPADDDEDFGF